jgi:TonB family protein
MQFNGKTEFFIVLGIIIAVGFGCKQFQLKDYVETPEEPKKTAITKEILSERLTARLVKKADKAPEKPNPLTHQLRFSNSKNDFLLNREYFENFGKLTNSLKEIFKEREYNGVFIEGTNEVAKKITLPAYQKTIDEYNSKNITVEDFEKLVDDLRNEGFDQIEFDINEENQIPEISNIREQTRIKPPFDSETDSKKTDLPKTISGGILNGKAIDLPKPSYPAAARAVRAIGAVNVQVTVDENGDVTSANAVSGHPLLRASAVAAARNAKFKPTLLSGNAVKVSGVIVYTFMLE